MVIKVLTCHNVYNYGASLQAYALQYYLDKQGCKVEIIDYRPLYLNRRYHVFYLSKNSKFYKIVKVLPFLLIFKIFTNRYMILSWRRKKRFDSFRNKYMYLTNVIYKSYNDLYNNPPYADLYIVGSDQVWNTDMENGHDKSFYLQFGNNNIKRISYAASFGIESISENVIDKVKVYLSSFDNVSVREYSGICILKAIGIKANLVLDPVFLLSKNEWYRIMRSVKPKIKEEKYILLYDFSNEDLQIKKMCLKLSKINRIKIISINDYKKNNYADININNAGPLEFLKYMEYAEYVICNSFHATAFSLILHKKFYTYPLAHQKNSSRIVDLLKLVDLEDRFNCTLYQNNDIVWEHVDKTLRSKIYSSKLYLNSNI